MYPVLFSIGPLTISSFGFFLALALVVTIFIIWRLVRVYDLDEEKTLDLVLLTFFGCLIGARILFVLLNWEVFGELGRILLINRYPGLSFWGGFLGGIFAFWLFLKRTKLNFWQVADLAVVGVTLGMVFGNIGCFLGGCAYGKVSNSQWATPIVGLIGRRFPISLIEALACLILFLFLWRQVVRFHFSGKIVAQFLVLLGSIKFLTEYYRGDSIIFGNIPNLYLGNIISVILIIWGIIVYYSKSKRKIQADISFIGKIFISGKARNQLIYFIKKYCYNCIINWKYRLLNVTDISNYSMKNLKRRLNVKPTPKNIR